MIKKTPSVLALSLILGSSLQGFSQFVVEPFVGDDNIVIESWFFKTIDEKGKFNVFNLNEAIYDFDTETTSFLSYAVFGYDLKKGFGPALGWRFTEPDGAALGGVQYAYYQENFFITANLTSEFRKNPNIELYSIIQYRKKINDKLAAFSQLQFSTIFRDESHNFSFQRLRLGVDFGKFQTGLGLNQTQFGRNFDYSADPGIFLRMELY